MRMRSSSKTFPNAVFEKIWKQKYDTFILNTFNVYKTFKFINSKKKIKKSLNSECETGMPTIKTAVWKEVK